MADYKAMYLRLFNAVTDALGILQAAQIETEKIYIEQEPAKITLLKPDNDGGETL